ncbi:MAG: iron ABC transporter permease [Bacteroidetes bacterium]|nr:iron ABC transporter permease [Bacteroidota bacterium]
MSLIIVLTAIIAAAMIGFMNINATQTIAIIGNKIGLNGSDKFTANQAIVLWNYRLPRILMALIIGGGLACSGAVLQGLLRNPLVEPGLIGVSSGAALFAVLFFVLGDKLPNAEILSIYILPIVSFFGAFLVTFLVYQLSKVNGASNIAFLLLAGIAINALCTSLIGLTLYFADDDAIRNFTFWTLGNLSGASWLKTLISLILVLLPSISMLYYYKVLDALNIGEEVAKQLGANVDQTKKMLIVLCALVVGCSVAMAGIIGFVGLLIPHLVRILIGNNHSNVLVGSIITGGLALLVADTIGRVIVAPAELPIGIITALVSTPFFLWLLLKVKNQFVF